MRLSSEYSSLEFIPNRPDFIDGDYVKDDHPVNEVHSGELPSEQDPRDKVEEDDDYDGECDIIEIDFTLPEVGDMTDLIENSIMAQRTANGSQRLGVNPFMWAAEQAGKGGAWLAGKGVNPDELMSGTPPNLGKAYQGYRERGRAKKVEEQYGEDYSDFNAFEQPEVQTVLKRYGLNEKEIHDFAVLRERHLSRFKSKDWSGKDVPQWGQGLGQTWTPRNYKTPPALNLDPYQQEIYRRWKPQGQQRYQQMSPEERKQVWYVMQKKYPQFWGNQKAQARQPAQPAQPVPGAQPGGGQSLAGWTPPTASRSLGKLRDHTNLVGGILAMPRTADVIRQTVNLVSAVHELDNGGSLDETTKSALRNTSRNLLTATDHLKCVNNRIANRVAGEIEQLFVDSLSN